VYDMAFAMCYVANTLLMTAISLLFRYADFVTYLGGSELELGLIVGVGMSGALAMRFVLGVGIDRIGPRRVWLFSIALFVASVLAHVLITRVDGIGVYALRVLFMVSVAGAFGASVTYVSLRAHQSRMAETIGVLGSSGFIGLALGPTLGDQLLAGGERTCDRIDNMFYLAAALGLMSWMCVALATRRATHRPQRRTPSIWALIRRYHPGWLLLVSLAMGLGTQMPNIFLRPYAAELEITRIKVYFLVYAAAAFTIRLSTRRWTDRLGVRPVALLGLGCLAGSMLLFLTVRSEWGLGVPAVLAGVAHAFLFPAVVSGGGSAFPARYRGLATTLVLAMFDIGALLGQPLVGILVEGSRRMGWPPYLAMFLSVSAFMGLVAVLYYLGTRRARPYVRRKRQPPASTRVQAAEPVETGAARERQTASTAARAAC
jgi:MFS family permease